MASASSSTANSPPAEHWPVVVSIHSNTTLAYNPGQATQDTLTNGSTEALASSHCRLRALTMTTVSRSAVGR